MLILCIIFHTNNLYYLCKYVLFGAKRKSSAIKEIPEGTGECRECRCMRGHRGITTTLTITSKRFYWRSTQSDVTNYVKSCSLCQKVNPKI